MKNKYIYGAGLGVLASAFFLFSACSHVEAPSQDGDDDEVSYNEKSERVPVEKDDDSTEENKSSKADSDDDDFDDSDGDDFSFDFDDNGSTSSVSVDFSSFFNPAENSSGNGEKYDCDFSVDDDVWKVDINEENGTGTGIITFTDRSSTIDLDVIAEDSSATSCEQGAALLNFIFGEVDNGDEFSFTCDGSTMNIKAHMTDTTQTAADKEELYKKMCK